jgi:hypothetical protein
MARRCAPAALLVVCLVAACGAHAVHGVVCPPGTGVPGNSLLGFLGGLLTGSGSSASDLADTCAACSVWEASAGGENARCELCTPLVSAPNSARSACDCLPGSYVSVVTESSGSSRKSCMACGPTAVSSSTNAAACTQVRCGGRS